MNTGLEVICARFRIHCSNLLASVFSIRIQISILIVFEYKRIDSQNHSILPITSPVTQNLLLVYLWFGMERGNSRASYLEKRTLIFVSNYIAHHYYSLVTKIWSDPEIMLMGNKLSCCAYKGKSADLVDSALQYIGLNYVKSFAHNETGVAAIVCWRNAWRTDAGIDTFHKYWPNLLAGLISPLPTQTRTHTWRYSWCRG